jgi:AcrR family transcriptional regulator
MAKAEIKENRKEEIFEASVRCFNEKGYYKTTIDDIAAAAGISKGGIYYHFKSKEELFLELFDYRVNKYLREMTSSLNAHDSPEERLGVLTKKAGQLFREHDDFYRFSLEFLSMGVRDPEIKGVMTGFYRDSTGILRALIDEGIEAGEFRDVESGKVARMIYFLVMGVFFTDLSVNIDFDTTDQVAFHMNTLFTSIRNK